MRESGQQLERLSKQSGASSVEKARPYYEARMRLRQVTGFSFFTIFQNIKSDKKKKSDMKECWR